MPASRLVASLPSPRTTGHLTGVRVEGDEVVQVFGSPAGEGAKPLTLPVAAQNYIYFEGGTIRFGKLAPGFADIGTPAAEVRPPPIAHR